ncbi:hypothetical protein [Streptococcus sp. FT1-106]
MAYSLDFRKKVLAYCEKTGSIKYCRFSHSMRELFYENLMNMP